MPLASLLNADIVIQPKGAIVRVGPVANSCLLAQADDPSHVAGLLGARLADVLAGNSGTLTGFLDGMMILLAGAASPGDPIYLSDVAAGVGTNVAPAIKVLLGAAYNIINDGGTFYAQVIQSSYIPQVPVPDVNSTANAFESDVVGNKDDDEDGNSSYARVFKTDTHVHAASNVYPTLATGVTVTKAAASWGLASVGAFVVVVPTNTITDPFDIHGLNFENVPDNGTYEIILYAGPNGSEQEIGRARFTRTAASDIELEAPFQTVINAANTQIKAKMGGSNASASSATFSIRYHVY